MPCPYFYPVERLDEALWAVPPRVPLLDAYRGECRAGEAGTVPEDELMRGVCNTGYSRGRCSRFPSDSSSDAVRFHVVEQGDDLRLLYVLEKECRPAGYGEIAYSVSRSCFTTAVLDAIIARQAAAFIESYLRRVHDHSN